MATDIVRIDIAASERIFYLQLRLELAIYARTICITWDFHQAALVIVFTLLKIGSGLSENTAIERKPTGNSVDGEILGEGDWVKVNIVLHGRILVEFVINK